MIPIVERKRGEPPEIRPGTGALCPESQADGVPCPTLDRDCEVCENAVVPEHRDPDAPPTETA